MGKQEKITKVISMLVNNLPESTINEVLNVIDRSALVDELSQRKGLQVSEYSYIYIVNDHYYYARINLKKLIPQIQKTDEHSVYHKQCLGRITLEDAKRKCWQLEADLRAIEKHGELKLKSVHSSAAFLIDFINKLKAKTTDVRSTRSDYIRCLEEYFLPAVQPLGPLRYLNSQFIYSYFEKLEGSGVINSKTRLTVHRSAVNLFIEDCIKLGLFKDEHRPKIPSAKQILDGRRLDPEQDNEPFEEQDLANIKANFDNFLQSTKKKKANVMHLRGLLQIHFDLLCAMGCRPGEEIMGISFSDMVKKTDLAGKSLYIATIKYGKTAKTQGPRDVELVNEAIAEVLFPPSASC